MYKISMKIRFDKNIDPENVGTASGTMQMAAEKCAKLC